MYILQLARNGFQPLNNVYRQLGVMASPWHQCITLNNDQYRSLKSWNHRTWLKFNRRADDISTRTSRSQNQRHETYVDNDAPAKSHTRAGIYGALALNLVQYIRGVPTT